MLIRIIISLARILLKLIANVKTTNFEAIPEEGQVIVVTNHLGRLDAALGVLLTSRTDVILMIAEKYQQYAVWRWFAKKLNAIWLNRFDVDYQAMRQVLKRLGQGQLLALAPEGTRSATESLAPGKPGAAYLAAKTGAPLIPVGLTGTEDRVVVSRLKRLRRLDIAVNMGNPFVLPPMHRSNKDAYLHEQTDEIMCQIAALLPPKYWGVYTEHPRLLELLNERNANGQGR
jgi:1-acyl-sn-glycerol-3-phosphate acyltransferase